ncbi:polyprotein [Olivavirus actinidiae]|uniref:Polyprotein n=1 Tax=Olivavirus actinidiae TaxID=2024724 RepID=A0A223A477_9CLOS|nr:polyprotein [Actinidia virus 1]ASR91587.1 polyprotein [Actinidia virus 1]
MAPPRFLKASSGRAKASVASRLNTRGECSKTLPKGWGVNSSFTVAHFFGAEDREVTFSRGCSRILDAYGLNPPPAVFYGPEPASPAFLKARANRELYSGVQRPFNSRKAVRQAAVAASLFEARRQRASKVHLPVVGKKRKAGPAFKAPKKDVVQHTTIPVVAPTVPVVVPTTFPVAYVAKGATRLPEGTPVFLAKKPAARTLGFYPKRAQREFIRLSLDGWSVTLDTESGVVTDQALLTLVKNYHYEAFLPLKLLAKHGAKLTPTLEYGWVRYDRNGRISRLLNLPYMWEVLQLLKRGECGPKLRAYIESFQDNRGYCYLKLFRMANIAIGRSARRVGTVCHILGSFPSTREVQTVLYRRYACIPDFIVGYKSQGTRGHMTTTPIVRVSALPDLYWGADCLMFGSIPASIPVVKAITSSPLKPGCSVSPAESPKKPNILFGSFGATEPCPEKPSVAMSKSAIRRLRRKNAAHRAGVHNVDRKVDTAVVSPPPAVAPMRVETPPPVEGRKVAPPTTTFIKPIFRDVKQCGGRLRSWFGKVNPNERVKDRLASLLSADGSGYNYNGGSHRPDKRSKILLAELSSILKIDLGWVKHALVQKYRPGSKIGAHKDNESCYRPLYNFRLVTINVFGEALFSLSRGAERYNIGLDGPCMFEIDPSVNFNFDHSVEVGRFFRGSITLRGHKSSNVLDQSRLTTDVKRNIGSVVEPERIIVSREKIGPSTVEDSGPAISLPAVEQSRSIPPSIRATGLEVATKPVVQGREEIKTDHQSFLDALTRCNSVGDIIDKSKYPDYRAVCQKHTYGLVYVYHKDVLVKKGIFRRYYDLKALRQLNQITDNLRSYLSSFRDSSGYCYLIYIRAVAMYFGRAETECSAAVRALGSWPKAGDLLSYIHKRYGTCPAIRVGYRHVGGAAVHADLTPVFLLANMRKGLRVGGERACPINSTFIKVGTMECRISRCEPITPYSGSFRVPVERKECPKSPIRTTNVGLDVSLVRTAATKHLRGRQYRCKQAERNVGPADSTSPSAAESQASCSAIGSSFRGCDSRKEYKHLIGRLVDRILDFKQDESTLNIPLYEGFNVICVKNRPGLVRILYKNILVKTVMANRYWDIQYLRSYGCVSKSLKNYLYRYRDGEGYCYLRMLRLCCIYFSKPMGYVRTARAELGSWPSSFAVKCFIRKTFSKIPPVYVSLSRGRYAHVGLLPRVSLENIPNFLKLGGHVESDMSMRRMTEVNRLNAQVERAQLKDSALLRAVESTLIEEHRIERQMQSSKPVVNVNVSLNDSQQLALVKNFPEMRLKFVPSVHSLHPMSSAVRMCFNALYSQKLGKRKYIDIGGDLKYHVMKGNDVHICNPILDPKDGVRYVNRVCEWNLAKVHDLNSMVVGSKKVSCCYTPAQNCDVSCSTAVAVEVYDISMTEMASIMAKRSIDRVYLTMLVPGELFDANSVTVCVPEHDIAISQEGDNLIYNMPAGQSYCHDRSSVLSYITNPYMLHGNQLFHSEMVGHRCGVCEFRVTRVPVYPAIDTIIHITIPRATSGLVELHLPNINKVSDVLDFDNITSVMVDYDFFTRALTHIINVCTNVSEKTFEYTMTWLRNNSARVVISGRIIHTNVKLAPEHIGRVAALLLTAGVKTRWESGRYARRLYRAVGQETLWESIKTTIHESTLTVKAAAYDVVKKILSSSFPFLGDLQSKSIDDFFTVLGESITITRAAKFPCSGGYVNGETRYIDNMVNTLLAEAVENNARSEIVEATSEVNNGNSKQGKDDKYVAPGNRSGKSSSVVREKIKAVTGTMDRCDGSKPGQGAGLRDSGSSLFLMILRAVEGYVNLSVRSFRDILLRIVSPFERIRTVLIPVLELWEKLFSGDADVWVTYGATVVYSVIRSIVYLFLGHSTFGVCLGLVAVIATPIPPLFITDKDNLSADILFEALKGAYFSVPLTRNKWLNRVLSVLENVGYFKSLVRRIIAVVFEESTAASVVMLVVRPEENVWAVENLVKKAYDWAYDQIYTTLYALLSAVPHSAKAAVANTIGDVAGGVSSVLTTSVAKVLDWFSNQRQNPPGLGQDGGTEEFFSMVDDVESIDDLLSETPGLRGGGVLNRNFLNSLIMKFLDMGRTLVDSVVSSISYIKSKLYPGSLGRTKKGGELLAELFSERNCEDEEYDAAVLYLNEFLDTDFSDAPGNFGGAVDCKSFVVSVYRYFRSFKFSSIVAMCQAILAFFVMTKRLCMVRYRALMAEVKARLVNYKRNNPAVALVRLTEIVDDGEDRCYRVPKDLFDADEQVRNLCRNSRPQYFKKMDVYRVPATIDYEDKNALVGNLVSPAIDFLMVHDSSDVSAIGLDFNLIKKVLGWTMTKDLVSRIPLARRCYPNSILMVRKGGYVIFSANGKPIVSNCSDLHLTPEKFDVIFMRLSGGLMGGGVTSWSFMLLFRCLLDLLEERNIISCHVNIACKVTACAASSTYRWFTMADWILKRIRGWYTHGRYHQNEMEIKPLSKVEEKTVTISEELKKIYSDTVKVKAERMDELINEMVCRSSDDVSGTTDLEISSEDSEGNSYNKKFFNKNLKNETDCLRRENPVKGSEVRGKKKTGRKGNSIPTRSYEEWGDSDGAEGRFKVLNIGNETKERFGKLYDGKRFELAEVIRNLDLTCPPVFTHTNDPALNAMNEFVFMHLMDVMNMLNSMKIASSLLVNDKRNPEFLRSDMVDPKITVLDTTTDLLWNTTTATVRLRDTQHRFCYDPKSGSIVSLGAYRVHSCSRYIVLHQDLEIFYANLILRRFEVNEKIEKVHYLNDLVVVETPPGGGKTTQLVALFFNLWMKGVAVRVVTANKNSAEEIRRKASALALHFKVVEQRYIPKLRQLLDDMVRTADSTIMNVVSAKTQVLLVDEIFLMHLGQLILNFEILKPMYVIGYGDSKQISYIPRTDLYCPVYHNVMDIIDEGRIIYRSESYRCPKDVCFLLSELYGRSIEARVNNRTDTMSVASISSIEDVPVVEDAKYLTYTQGEKYELSNTLRRKGRRSLPYLDPQTVHEAQGNTYKKVILVRSKPQDDSVFSSVQHHTVALSRHTDSLIYYCISSKYNDDTASKIERSKVLSSINMNEINEQPIIGAEYECSGGNPAASCSRAGAMGWQAIVSFLDEVVPGSTVLTLNDISEALSTSEFESCVDKIRIGENMTVGKQPLHSNCQRVWRNKVTGCSR